MVRWSRTIQRRKGVPAFDSSDAQRQGVPMFQQLTTHVPYRSIGVHWGLRGEMSAFATFTAPAGPAPGPGAAVAVCGRLAASELFVGVIDR